MLATVNTNEFGLYYFPFFIRSFSLANSTKNSIGVKIAMSLLKKSFFVSCHYYVDS